MDLVGSLRNNALTDAIFYNCCSEPVDLIGRSAFPVINATNATNSSAFVYRHSKIYSPCSLNWKRNFIVDVGQAIEMPSTAALSTALEVVLSGTITATERTSYESSYS